MWENVVTCCRSCNTHKGNKTLKKLGLKLKESLISLATMSSKKLEECFHLIFYIRVGMITSIGILS